MEVCIQTFGGGTIEVTVNNESYLVSQQDTIMGPYILTFPKVIVIEDPPGVDMTGIIVPK